MLYRIRTALEDAILDVRSRLRPHADIAGVRVPLDPRLSIPMRRVMINALYESHELSIIQRTLETNDRVLECGAGIGLLSAFSAKRVGSDRVKTFEANPHMASIIKRTYALNDVSPSLVVGAIGPKAGRLQFHVAKDFWASSSNTKLADHSLETITVPMYALHAEIVAHQPTYLFIDIEGGEEQLVGCSELPGVKKLMVEVHPKLTGEAAVLRFERWLNDLGFVKDPLLSTRTELFLARH